VPSRRLTAALLLFCLSACGHKSTPTGPTGPSEPAPQIACGASISTTITGPSAPVSFALPTTTGGTQPVSVSCTPASGSAFPLGTTAVLCTATDASSRQAVCGFDVVAKGIQFGAKKFSAVGDSLTEGENGNGVPGICAMSFSTQCLDAGNSYPTKLQALFDGSFPGQGIVVVNHGQGGKTSAQTLDALTGFLNSDHPEAVLVLSGYNDLTTPCAAAGYSDSVCDDAINSMQDGIRGIIRTAKGYSGVRYVFVSTLTPGRPGDRQIDGLRISDANTHIKNVVAAEGAVLVDSYPLFVLHESTYVSIDGLHLQPPGYQAIAQAFFDKILATVPQSNPQSYGAFNFRR
jgi:lysophospholipase L1-like esterase